MTAIAGIGSRQTPEHILKEMELIGQWARTNEILVRSGHAEGADYAFEKGAQDFARPYLPWKNFNKELPHLGHSVDVGDNKELDTWVDQYHPAPQHLSFGGRKLMRRNVCQVLSQSLNDPVKAIVCWTASGVALLLIIGVACCGTVMSFNNECVDLETQIKAQYDKNQAVYDTTWKTIKETANVADAHSDKLKEIVTASIQGRYANDQSVLFKAIAESNGANLPVDLYKKVQQVIESGRQQFLANQTELISKKQTYEKHLRTFPNTMYAGLLGFPKIKLEDYGIVTSDKTENAFKTKKDEPILPFAK